MDIPRIRKLEFRKRTENVSNGSGEIKRELYCEPYAAYPRVERALLGTVDANSDPPSRTKPHQDPVHSHFFCASTAVESMAREAMAGSPSTGFAPASDDDREAMNVRESLGTMEDPRGFVGNPADVSANTPSAGAIITATYRPLIILQGLSQQFDPFDFVDLQIEPILKTQLVGRDLNFLLGSTIPGKVHVSPIDNSPAVVSETVWGLTMRRLMVPKIPTKTIFTCANKINRTVAHIAGMEFPSETLRFDGAETINKRGVDGTPWYDLVYHFSARTAVDQAYDATTSHWSYMPVGWNRRVGFPARVGGHPWNAMGYYQTGWLTGINPDTPTSDFRYEHLYVEDTMAMSFDALFRLRSE